LIAFPSSFKREVAQFIELRPRYRVKY